MAETGDHRPAGDQPSGGDRRPIDPGEGDRLWARVVQDAPQGAAWTSHKISTEEIDQLHAFFFEVLELPEMVIEDSRR